MAVEIKDPASLSEKAPQEGNQNLPKKDLTDVVFWAMRKLIPVEQRLYATGVFDLIENFLIEQKIQLLWFVPTRSSQVKRQLLILAGQGLKEPSTRTNEPDLTEVLVWALRKITPIENRLYATGVFEHVDNWLPDQETQLMNLLCQHPKHVKRELAIRQQGQTSTNKSVQHHSE